jgi:hypothetical protein
MRLRLIMVSFSIWGGDGAVGSLGREYRAALDALVITTKGGATKSKDSFSEVWGIGLTIIT